MTNEEKAKEIACVSNRICSKNCENEKFCGLNFGRKCALQAMQWKDAYYKKLLDLLVESGADVDIITNYIKNCIEL